MALEGFGAVFGLIFIVAISVLVSIVHAIIVGLRINPLRLLLSALVCALAIIFHKAVPEPFGLFVIYTTFIVTWFLLGFALENKTPRIFTSKAYSIIVKVISALVTLVGLLFIVITSGAVIGIVEKSPEIALVVFFPFILCAQGMYGLMKGK